MDGTGMEVSFGVGPGFIPDYLALVGDTADGIRWHPRHSTVGSQVHDADLVVIRPHRADTRRPSGLDVQVRGEKALAANLAAHRQEAILYRELATLRLDVRLFETLAELEWRGVRQKEF